MPRIVCGKKEKLKRERQRMERKIVVKKMHSNESDEYIENPEESLDIVEKLRQEAGHFLYGNTSSFQRIITVIRKTQR